MSTVLLSSLAYTFLYLYSYVFSDMRCSYCNDQIHKLTRATFIACFCKQTNYCDQRCQKADWGKGGHRERCEYWAKIVKNLEVQQKRQEKQRELEKRPNAHDHGPEVTSKRVNHGKSDKPGEKDSEIVEKLDRSKNVKKRPKSVEIENSQEFADVEGIASRDSKGRFVQSDSDMTQVIN